MGVALSYFPRHLSEVLMATASKNEGQKGSRPDTNARDGSADGRQALIDALNEDLRREYQAIIAYVIYSQVIKGAEYMKLASELEQHAAEELKHALTISRQIDYLGGEPANEPMPVRTSTDAREMLQFDLDNETETIKHYRDRVKQCEALGEYAMAEHIREILIEEQDHQIELATALGKAVPRT
jgi:bacterioferritin